jgi:hypothetical protein
MEQEPQICTNIEKIIHDRSASGRLVQPDEILAELREQGLLESEDDEQKARLATLLEQVMEENRDLKVISGRNGNHYYYSVHSLSETYAGILARKSDSPVWLMAEVVRENSHLYPRPVPVESFREPPFGLTGEEIAKCLTSIGDQREYRDIAQTITSVGTPFLYSTLHLDPDHAAALAEWFDVGQVNNP